MNERFKVVPDNIINKNYDQYDCNTLKEINVYKMTDQNDSEYRLALLG